MDEERLRDEAADLARGTWRHQLSEETAVGAAERLIEKAIELGRREGARHGGVGPSIGGKEGPK